MGGLLRQTCTQRTWRVRGCPKCEALVGDSPHLRGVLRNFLNTGSSPALASDLHYPKPRSFSIWNWSGSWASSRCGSSCKGGSCRDSACRPEPRAGARSSGRKRVATGPILPVRLPNDDGEIRMTHLFPHRYVADLVWQADLHGEVSGPSKAPFITGPPPEFGGRPEWWSPEHLLLSAANACLMTTFLALAGRERIPVLGYRSHAEGVLHQTRAGIVFTATRLRAAIGAPSGSVEQAERVIQPAK